MLLSALALAAALQAAPEISLKGHLVAPRLEDRAQPVGELIMPVPKSARRMSADAAWTRRPVSPPFKLKPPRRTLPPATFVHNPMTANCNSHGLSQAGHPETLTVQPLSKMPKAHGERAVARLVDGCPVAVLIAQR